MTLLRRIAWVAALSAAFVQNVNAGGLNDGDVDASFSGDGDAVTAFDLGGGDTDTAPSVLIDPVDRIITVAEVAVATGTRIGMSRHLSNGTPDSSFGLDGKRLLTLPLGPNIRTPKVMLSPDGKLYLLVSEAGADDDYDWALCRLFVAGNPDPDFGTDGCVKIVIPGGGLGDAPTAMAPAPFGRILIGGYVQTADGFRVALARLNDTGSFDGSFGDVAGRVVHQFPGFAATRIQDLATLEDGRIAFVGRATRNGASETDVLVGRLTATGQIDPTYFGSIGFRAFGFDLAGPGNFFSNDAANALALDRRTGAVTVVGRAQESATASSAFIARLTGSGLFDNSFNGDGLLTVGFSGAPGGIFTDVKIDGRKKTYAYGHARNGSGNLDLLLMRFNFNGTIDGFFGDGRIFHNVGPVGRDNFATELHFMAGKALLVGSSQVSGLDYDLNLSRLWLDLIFTDGAE